MKSRNLFQLLLKVFAVSFDFALASFILSTISAGLAVVQGQQQQQIAKANAARLNMQAERERQAANRNAQIAAQRNTIAQRTRRRDANRVHEHAIKIVLLLCALISIARSASISVSLRTSGQQHVCSDIREI